MMEDDYSKRRGVQDSAAIAGGCFVGIVVLFAVMGAVQMVRWVVS